MHMSYHTSFNHQKNKDKKMITSIDNNYDYVPPFKAKLGQGRFFAFFVVHLFHYILVFYSLNIGGSEDCCVSIFYVVTF